MKKLFTSICAAAMMAVFSAPVPAVAQDRSGLTVEQMLRGPDRGRRDGSYREGYRDRGYYRERGGLRYRDRDRWHGQRSGWYRGHRGYRDYRPGYRRYDGFWFPPAAFITGAIVGGAIASQPAPRGYARDYGSAHENWCYNRYRSYRAYDNTFQPYNGPRRECRSPYY
jgi:hypothetical protein